MNGDTPESADIAVLKSDCRRHEAWLVEHDKRLAAQEKCSDAIPELRDLIKKEVLPAIKSLNECKIASEAVAKTKVPFMDTKWGDRLWNLVQLIFVAAITWVVTVSQYISQGK